MFKAPLRLLKSVAVTGVPLLTSVAVLNHIGPVVFASNTGIKMTDPTAAASIYDFTVKDTFGKDVALDKYRGHVVIVVNIASQCGLAKSNFASLTELKNKYYDAGLRVLAFPCNQFASESPEADGEEMTCSLASAKADVGDVFKKVDVNGDAASPLWVYLKHKQGGMLGFDGIKWNFTKFLVDKSGQPVERFGPTTDPLDIGKKIEKLLAA